jgi:hypothetical protein
MISAILNAFHFPPAGPRNMNATWESDHTFTKRALSSVADIDGCSAYAQKKILNKGPLPLEKSFWPTLQKSRIGW